jgi:hypothetical protein
MISQINTPLRSLFTQLADMLVKLTDEQYGKSISLLSGASIGQHTRHIIELFLELEKGYDQGVINYDGRKRDHETETYRSTAIGRLTAIAARLERDNKPLTLMAAPSGEEGRPCLIQTNYQRELVYNLEHSVHHMALLRIGINAVSAIELPDSFGVAASTMEYRKACVR